MPAPESSLYVVSFPNSLKFYVDDSPICRQVLKIYNTYEFPIKFRGECSWTWAGKAR